MKMKAVVVMGLLLVGLMGVQLNAQAESTQNAPLLIADGDFGGDWGLGGDEGSSASAGDDEGYDTGVQPDGVDDHPGTPVDAEGHPLQDE